MTKYQRKLNRWVDANVNLTGVRVSDARLEFISSACCQQDDCECDSMYSELIISFEVRTDFGVQEYTRTFDLDLKMLVELMEA